MKHARSDYDRIQDPQGLIPDGEPVFLLRAQDKHFLPMLERYRTLVERDVDSDTNARLAISESVRQHIDLTTAWQAGNLQKAPDLPTDLQKVALGAAEKRHNDAQRESVKGLDLRPNS